MTTSAATADLEALSGAGITAHRGAFDVAWVDRLHRDVLAAFEEARRREGGAIGRGPHRWYVEIHPEQLSGFVELVTHPWVTGICRSVLGPEYRIIEIGFDIPLPGAVDQPWHRDFPSPEQTHTQHRLTSLAFNISTVDTTPDMGPFQIAPGTQYEAGLDWEHQMFPPRAEWPRYQAASQLRMPQRGDISARSALALHRGTANQSQLCRPVVVLGVIAPEVGPRDRHDMTVTRPFWEGLPDEVRRHLDARVVDALQPVVQKHDIEGLVMGAADD